MQKQITEYIEKFLSPYLCGYRKGFNTQYALVAMIEKWKKCLDGDGGFAGAILMDLSKAFNTLNHELLIAKLNAYGSTSYPVPFISIHIYVELILK